MSICVLRDGVRLSGSGGLFSDGSWPPALPEPPANRIKQVYVRGVACGQRLVAGIRYGRSPNRGRWLNAAAAAAALEFPAGFGVPAGQEQDSQGQVRGVSDVPHQLRA